MIRVGTGVQGETQRGALPSCQWPSLSKATDRKLQGTADIDLPFSHKYLLLTSLYEALLQVLTSEEETKARLLKSMCSGDIQGTKSGNNPRLYSK